jgi:hypothetical protein
MVKERFLSSKITHHVSNKPILLVSFSGGETSGYLSYRLKKEYGEYYHIIFMFSNTGCENEATLDFVHACDKAFDLNVVWIEAVVNPEHGKGITHRLTTYENAFRVHQYKDPKHPFHAHIRKSGIPNANKPQCSDRLKAFAIEDYKRSMKYAGAPHAIGIRADEARRIMNPSLKKLVKLCGDEPERWRNLPTHKERLELLENTVIIDKKDKEKIVNFSRKLESYGLVYPLADWFVTDKYDVKRFWSQQSFQLAIEDHEGNCQTCWKKSDLKLYLVALEHPDRFEAFAYWERQYQHVKPNRDGKPRVFFRKHRSATDMIHIASHYNSKHLRKMIGAVRDDDNLDGCSESCESYKLF